MRSFSIVVAADLANGIGFEGKLPWRLKKDMAFFARITSKIVHSTTCSTRVNACIMGRVTWESIPARFRPLSSRFNVIVTRNPHYLDNKPEKNNPLVALASSFEDALDLVESLQGQSPVEPGSSPSSSVADIQVERIFLIGGAQLYNQGILSKDCSNIFMTRIQAIVKCDTFFPNIDPSQYRLLPRYESHTFLENYLQEPVEAGIITEGEYSYEYTVYHRDSAENSCKDE
ncbi:hypothetical protein BGZ65_002179 [Modicella reniformis]|uniref:Dihydrofolate reductase n=1 Tax=Modicella reniformis TaxID=1440133 RepID=A0A9P6M9U0_9FUNG|nr:hypothetical protein BGZ65_002179 [Modicella reniformis]